MYIYFMCCGFDGFLYILPCQFSKIMLIFNIDIVVSCVCMLYQSMNNYKRACVCVHSMFCVFLNCTERFHCTKEKITPTI